MKTEEKLFSIMSTDNSFQDNHKQFYSEEWKDPQKIRLFLCKIHQKCLLTNSIKVIRGLNGSGDFPRCHMVEENQLHSPMDCHLPKICWSQIGVASFSDFFVKQDISHWIVQNLCRTDEMLLRVSWGAT